MLWEVWALPGSRQPLLWHLRVSAKHPDHGGGLGMGKGWGSLGEAATARRGREPAGSWGGAALLQK